MWNSDPGGMLLGVSLGERKTGYGVMGIFVENGLISER